MVYILDTNIFRKILEHLPRKGESFVRIWNAIELGIQNKVYQSVDECYNELDAHYDDSNENMQWLKDHKGMFLVPTSAESCIIRKLFEKPKMRDLCPAVGWCVSRLSTRASTRCWRRQALNCVCPAAPVVLP